MRSAVVYYSLDGNTKAASELLAKDLGAELIEVKTDKPYPRKGIAKMFVGGRDSTFGRLPAINDIDMDPSDYDLVVIACPVWAGKAAAPINSFLKGREFGSCRVALMVSSASGDGASCARDLAAKVGKPSSDLRVLSLKNPSKMGAAELSSQVDGFAKDLFGADGGGGAF